MDWLDSFRRFQRFYKKHALKRMIERDISFDDVVHAVGNGQVIAEYLDDSPLPSCLVSGHSIDSGPLHVVFSIDSENQEVYVITTYIPNAEIWNETFDRRK